MAAKKTMTDAGKGNKTVKQVSADNHARKTKKKRNARGFVFFRKAKYVRNFAQNKLF